MIDVRHLVFHTIATAALVAAVVAPATPAQAQRMSLAERVDRLEQQAAQNGGGNAVDLVNQISALQSQVQTLQGQVEELKHDVDQAQRRNKDQYIDLDSRIGRLEGHGAAAAPPPVAGGNANAQPPDIDLGNPGGRVRAPAPAPSDELTPEDHAAGADMEANPPGDASAVYNDAFAALKDGRYAESARRFQASSTSTRTAN